MESRIMFFLACTLAVTSAWSLPYPTPPRAPMRFTRFAPPPYLRPHLHGNPHHKIPVPVEASEIEEPQHRPKRGHDDYDHDHDHYGSSDNNRKTSGVTGPVHTFVKTDKNANYKWGVRHHVGDKYAS